MEAREFVTAIRQNVIDSDALMYQTSLDNVTDAKDPVWMDVLPIYRNLTTDQKKAFLKFIRLVQVNAVSHLFGILDGSSFLNENRDSLILSTEASEDVINGDLADIFWEMEEEAN